ncbi:MAG: metal ABC transporter permease [Candidatus Binatia bacterium]
MIENFLSSWPLFQNAYLSGWLIAILLAIIGVFVVARDQIFIGAAVSQASLLGISIGIWLGSRLTLDETHWWRSEVFHSLMGGCFAIIAALLTARGEKTAGRETHEAITGWVFLFAMSMSILLMAHSPHGLEEVNRLLSSTIIGATQTDVGIFSVMTTVTIILLSFYHRQALLVILDPEMARAVGLRVEIWEGAYAFWLGAIVGFSIHVSGVIYAFACLVLPPLAAKNISRDVHTLFVISPVLALSSGIVAFVLANHYDYPPGQMATTCLCCVVLIMWGFRYIRTQ